MTVYIALILVGFISSYAACRLLVKAGMRHNRAELLAIVIGIGCNLIVLRIFE